MCGHHLSSMNPDFPTFAAIAIGTPPAIICIPPYRSSGTAIPKLYAGWVGGGVGGGMIADCTRRCPGAPVSTICAAAVQQHRWRNALAAPGLKGCHFVHIDSTGIIIDVHWIQPAIHLYGQAQSFVTDALRYTHYIIGVRGGKQQLKTAEVLAMKRQDKRIACSDEITQSQTIRSGNVGGDCTSMGS